MRLPSASSLQRVAQCPASAVLPQVNSSNDAAKRGTLLHEFVCNARSYGVAKALTMAPEEVRGECFAMQLGPLHALMGERTISHEVTFAWDVETGKARTVGVNLNRNYHVSDSEFVGTADIFAYEPGKHVVVLDMKTGKHPVPAAAVNWQLRALAFMGALVHGATSATVAIAYLQDDGSWNIDRADLDAMDLDAIETDLRRLERRIDKALMDCQQGGTPDVFPSADACQWCPAIRSCPATTSLVRQLPPTLASIQERLTAMTPAQLGESWQVMERAESALKIIREGMMAILRETPFELPNGKHLKVIQGSRETIDGTTAQRILVEQFSADAAVKACKPTVTKASLKTALGKDADRAIEAIRQAGGISVTTTNTVKEQ